MFNFYMPSSKKIDHAIEQKNYALLEWIAEKVLANHQNTEKPYDSATANLLRRIGTTLAQDDKHLVKASTVLKMAGYIAPPHEEEQTLSIKELLSCVKRMPMGIERLWAAQAVAELSVSKSKEAHAGVYEMMATAQSIGHNPEHADACTFILMNILHFHAEPFDGSLKNSETGYASDEAHALREQTKSLLTALNERPTSTPTTRPKNDLSLQ